MNNKRWPQAAEPHEPESSGSPGAPSEGAAPAESPQQEPPDQTATTSDVHSTVVGGAHDNAQVIQVRDVRVGTFVSTVHNHGRQEADWPVRVGNVPEQAPHFQPRAITNRLTEALDESGTVVLRQVLSGTGGVGKTQLAAHHARALAQVTNPEHRVDVLVWTDASSRDRITSAYAQAARHLYPTVSDDPEQAASLFLTWLGDPNKHGSRRWLVVWDDLTDPADVRDLWPPHDQPNGRMLVTTRRRDHSLSVQGRQLIDVDVYTPEEARSFLVHALDEAGVPHTDTDMDDLAEALGRLPLALSQAVTYMAELGMGCPAYLELFRDRMTTLGEVFPDWESPTPLAATWELSLAQADSYAPQGVARPLMGLIALLDGSGIPERVLTAEPIIEYLEEQRPGMCQVQSDTGQ